jgi:penicillin-binding protein 2
LALLCEKLGIEYTDHLPVSDSWPFTYTLDTLPTAWKLYFQLFLVSRGDVDSDISAPLLMSVLRKSYDIPEEWSEEDARKVIGLRYEISLRNGVTNLPNYVFVEDASEVELAAILELNIPGLRVEASSVRSYNTVYAAHTLGYVGAMSATQWEHYRPLGYEMDALVGQDGVELAFEEYLHGVDGIRVDEVSPDGTVIRSWYEVEPKPGNNVEISLDLMMQTAAEDQLAAVIRDLQAQEDGKAGKDVEGAAVVAIDVKTGQVLVSASYPTYDPAKLLDEYNSIMNQPYKPLLNRALTGTYPPGSTYKMVMSIAGIQTETVQRETTIYDWGVFSKYGFSANCLVYTNYGWTHGAVDCEHALKVSCNYYYYYLADIIPIEYIDAISKGLGLGELTGVELYESHGVRANPQSKASLFAGTDSANWYYADSIMNGIGQSINSFTPIQMASYTMGLANQGIRYRATFLNRVLSSDYRKLLYENKAQVLTTLDITDEAYETYLAGMKLVAGEVGGSVYGTFGNYPVAVAGKTGTAEAVAGASDNGAFVCFAPADDPQIAIAVYGEKAAGGLRLATVAKEILDVYFGFSTGDTDSLENQLG